MSQENVEHVRRWIRLSNARDFGAVYNEILDPDIECYPNPKEPHAAPWRGRDEYLKRVTDEREYFDQYRIEEVECFAIDDYVVCVARHLGRGEVSQAEVIGHETWLTRWRDGKCVEYRECDTKERALEVVGLSE